MIVLAIAGVAFGLGLGVSLATRRDGVAAVVGVVVFLAAAIWQASGGEEADDGGEPISGAAGVVLALVWVLVPWLLGILVARLIRRSGSSG